LYLGSVFFAHAYFLQGYSLFAVCTVVFFGHLNNIRHIMLMLKLGTDFGWP